MQTDIGIECLQSCPQNMFIEVNGSCVSQCKTGIFDRNMQCYSSTDSC